MVIRINGKTSTSFRDVWAQRFGTKIKTFLGLLALSIILLFVLENLLTQMKEFTLANNTHQPEEVASKKQAAAKAGDVEAEAVVVHEESCLRPRNNIVPKSSSLSNELQRPFINLGMPKMGSSSLHVYFGCGGYTSVHYHCGDGFSCADCMAKSIQTGMSPLSKCNKADSYTQIDTGPERLPQVNYLDEIVDGIPNATFILTFRNMTNWYKSLSNFHNMRGRFQRANITGFPSGMGRNVTEFSDFYCAYVQRVREKLANSPQHVLIEIDIEDPLVGQRMEEAFGVNRTCWGHANVNDRLHPGANKIPQVGWLIKGTEGIGAEWAPEYRMLE